jgi:hypothetical protein
MQWLDTSRRDVLAAWYHIPTSDWVMSVIEWIFIEQIPVLVETEVYYPALFVHG